MYTAQAICPILTKQFRALSHANTPPKPGASLLAEQNNGESSESSGEETPCRGKTRRSKGKKGSQSKGPPQKKKKKIRRSTHGGGCPVGRVVQARLAKLKETQKDYDYQSDHQSSSEVEDLDDVVISSKPIRSSKRKAEDELAPSAKHRAQSLDSYTNHLSSSCLVYLVQA
jgi:hypothetical protein